MIEYFKDLKVILIAVLVVVIAITQFKSCNVKPVTPTIVTKIDTVYKEVRISVPQYVPKYIVQIKDSIREVHIPAKVDTAAILKDYFTKYKVVDTLRLLYSKTDKRQFGYGVLSDVISQNRIIGRSIEWDYQIPTIEKTTVIVPPAKNQLYFGFNAAFGTPRLINSVSTGVLFKNKSDVIYQFMGGFANTPSGITPVVTTGIFWKISLRKTTAKDLLKLAN